MNIPAVNPAFLLITERTEALWPLALQRALSSVGDLHTMPEEQALQAGTATEYDVVIIDAGGVSDVFSLLSRVRKAKPQYRVVVATASPTWRRARAALHAGAADYICKSLDTERLCSSIEAVLELPPPPWSQ